MKRKKCFLIIISILLFMSCEESVNEKANKFLGNIPLIEKKYGEKLEKKETEIQQCTNIEKAYKFAKEKKILKEEMKKTIAEYISNNPLTKDLPFQSLSNTKYTIKKVVVNKVSSSNLNIKFLIKINDDIKGKYGSVSKNLFIYFKALDSKENYIQNSTTVATNFKSTKLVAGTEYKVFGSWQNKATRNMKDFAKIVEVTREEWKENKKK